MPGRTLPRRKKTTAERKLARAKNTAANRAASEWSDAVYLALIAKEAMAHKDDEAWLARFAEQTGETPATIQRLLAAITETYGEPG